MMLAGKDTVEVALLIRGGGLSSAEATRAAIERIELLNPQLNAVVTPLYDMAISRAAELDRLAAAGDLCGPLHGVPILIKDLFDPLVGVRNTFGCVATKDFVPDATAAHVQRLIDAGAVVVGKTNTPEFGHKGITDNRLFGPTRCPFDLERNAGGSSGGSAAAVASGMVSLAQGSDAGGSIRIPAAWCGVVGFYPSFGRVPNTGGPNAFGAHTPCVQAGPLTRTVRDAALAAGVMFGPHPADPLSLPDTDCNLMQAATEPTPRLRLRYSQDFGGFPVEPTVKSVVDACVGALAGSQPEIDSSAFRFSVSPDEMAQLWRRQVGLAYADMFDAMSFDGKDFLAANRDAIPEAVHEMVDAARSQSALAAGRDQRLRTLIYHELQQEMDACDILLTPTLASLPVPNATGGTTLGPAEVAGTPTERTIGWCLTFPVNFCGNPAASVPAGFSEDGLPVGLQIIGRRCQDTTVIAMAAEVERIRGWKGKLDKVQASLVSSV